MIFRNVMYDMMTMILCGAHEMYEDDCVRDK